VSQTKAHAATLRAVASELEAAAALAPRSAKEVIQRFAPPVLALRQGIPLEYVGHVNYDVRYHLTRQAGAKLADAITQKLEYDLVSGKSEINYMRDGILREAFYEARVFVFTPHQLTELVERAMRAGRGV